MKEMLIFVVGSIIFCFNLGAQSFPLQSFYRTNWQLVNPAAIDRIVYARANSKTIEGTSLALGSRAQWIDSKLDKKPITNYLSWESWPKIKNENSSMSSNIRLGAQLYRHKFGEESLTGGHFNFTYRLKLGKDNLSHLFISLNPGIQAFIINKDALLFQDDGDIISSESINRILFDVLSCGVFYVHENNNSKNRNWYLGVSIPPGISRENFDNNWSKHVKNSAIYLLGGYYHSFSSTQASSGVDLELSGILRTTPGYKFPTINGLWNNDLFNFEGNLRAYLSRDKQINKPTWLGVGMGSNGVFTMEVGGHIIYDFKPTTGNLLRFSVAYSTAHNKVINKPSLEFNLVFAKFRQAVYQ